jgi:hypothetical protein
LAVRYGEERGWEERIFLVDGGCEDTWGIGKIGGGWFREHISKKVGDGAGTYFWTNLWLGVGSFESEVWSLV